MASVLGFVHRNWLGTNPPTVQKSPTALKLGILGAADIAPLALITPAKSHPDVVVHTVAARDMEKAKAYAKKNGIPHVAKSYQDILDDSEIDAVYIPLPNGLHYEWAQRALKAGKHVLLEKPSTNNANDTERLFMPTSQQRLTTAPAQPVLLEATHSYFHPAWAAFMSHVTPSEVSFAEADFFLPYIAFGADNIRFKFDIGGGALLDLGAYTASALSRIFGSVAAESCESCEADPEPGEPRCDRGFRARYRFSGGRVGEMAGKYEYSGLYKVLGVLRATHRASVVSAADASAAGGGRVGTIAADEEILRTRVVSYMGFVLPMWYHSIGVEDRFEVRKKGNGDSTTATTRTWKTNRTFKAYTWREAGLPDTKDQPGEPFWGTYRYQLEQFVNKVRGREAKQWVSPQDSVNTMRMLDMAYEAAALPPRPSSAYLE